MARKVGRLHELLEDERIAAWHKSMATSSLRTADGTVQRLGILSRLVELSPSELVALAGSDPRRLEGLLVDFVAKSKEKGHVSAYTAGIVAALRAWFRSQRVAFDGFPRVVQVGGETVVGERVPTLDELQRIVDAIPTPRGKVVALSMAHAGLRPGTLGFYRGGEALRLRNLPELDVETLTFSAVPFIIEVPGAISKNRQTYLTFGSKILADRIIEYLRHRRGIQTVYRREKGDGSRFVPTKLPGEKLTRDSPFVTGEQYDHLGKFVSEKAIMVELARAIERARPEGVSWAPYVLRSYCSTRLWEASMEGVIDFQTREAILGHNAGISALYSSRRKLEASTVEKMRAAYKRCEPYLSRVPTDDKERLRSEFRGMVASMLGLTDDDVKEMEGLTPEQVGEFVRERLRGPARQPQRIVSVGEAEGLLASGWEATTALSDGRLVVRAPSVTMQDHPRLPTLMRQPGGGE